MCSSPGSLVISTTREAAKEWRGAHEAAKDWRGVHEAAKDWRGVLLTWSTHMPPMHTYPQDRSCDKRMNHSAATVDVSLLCTLPFWISLGWELHRFADSSFALWVLSSCFV